MMSFGLFPWAWGRLERIDFGFNLSVIDDRSILALVARMRGKVRSEWSIFIYNTKHTERGVSYKHDCETTESSTNVGKNETKFERTWFINI